jgi:argonaute-like protein implicated in RNA metabolism and viral defense
MRYHIKVGCSVCYSSKGQLEGKDVGEMLAAVIKTINNLLWRSMASSVGAPKWGQSRGQ